MTKEMLVVYVPGTSMTTEQWSPLINKLKISADLCDDCWLGWDHGCRLFSTASVYEKASMLNAAIDAKWRQKRGFRDVVLVGHSFGGFLVRLAYLLASGCYKNEPPSPWAENVKRFVLLAAVNRGVNQAKIEVRIYDVITRSLGTLFRRHFLGQDFISGSDFLTDTRLRWIHHMSTLDSTKRPSVYQILGTRDSVVARSDSIDLEQFPNAVHISVDGADHKVLPLIQKGPNQDYRFEIIRDSILGRNVSAKAAPPLQTDKFENVVFILHGIRAANRGWVQSLAQNIKTLLPSCQVVTPSYGYLSALEFALPFLHRRPIREFQQLYSDYYIQNPSAKFHFVGHSNGTYVLGWALRAIPFMRFAHVSLAGCILPRSFPWRDLMKGNPPQVEQLRNDCANKDWPVGFLCCGLRGLGRHDIGTAGYDGFYYDDNKVVQYWFHKGGHSAALVDENLENIAGFIAEHKTSVKPLKLVGEDQAFSFLSRLAPWVFRLFLTLLTIAVLYSLFNLNYTLFGTIIGFVLLVALSLKIL